MVTPVPFRERSREMQVVLAGVVPAGIGALAGVLIGASATAYWVVALLAALGGFASGFEHPDLRSAAQRGLVAGAIYGIGLLVAHAIAGTHAKVSLGSFPPLLAVITAIIGMLVAVGGGRIARAQRDRADVSVGGPTA